MCLVSANFYGYIFRQYRDQIAIFERAFKYVPKLLNRFMTSCQQRIKLEIPHFRGGKPGSLWSKHFPVNSLISRRLKQRTDLQYQKERVIAVLAVPFFIVTITFNTKNGYRQKRCDVTLLMKPFNFFLRGEWLYASSNRHNKQLQSHIGYIFLRSEFSRSA